jgi:hypothetical protein
MTDQPERRCRAATHQHGDRFLARNLTDTGSFRAKNVSAHSDHQDRWLSGAKS